MAVKDGQRHPQAGYASLVFDCDSTLASIEGIDELAEGFTAEIRALTDAAMDGSVPLEEVYGRRLEIIRPTRERVEALGRLYIERAVEDAAEVISALLEIGKDVRVVSGGLLPPVLALARSFGLPDSAVAAVGIHFTEDGSYAGFDTGSPLARSRGKADVIRQWALARPSMMIGDGSTDLEAKGEVDLFVGYMGVVDRPAVAAAADLVLRTESLAPILAIAAGESDRHRLEAKGRADLLRKGDSLLRDAGIVLPAKH